MPDPDRQPPHNLEAEEAVLGAILTAGRLLADVAAVLEEADFYRPAHRAIWRAILRLADRGEPTDPVTVLGELDDSGDLADVGGAPFLHTLVEAVPTVANAGHYARLVAEAARRRRVIDLGIQLTHSDADPAVLAHLAGELADTTSGSEGRGWEPPILLGATGAVPAFPVEVLPGWLGEYVAAVATATQTPADLAGMLALAVLATVAAGAVEVQPRPGWREPLCLFVAVGMDAGNRKSSVFTALTQPVAEFERQQAAAALPAITETMTLRRIADQAAAQAEAAASKAPADQHMAGWAAKLAGASCRLAGLLHLASHLRDGWAQPIGPDTFANAIRLADYLIEHARAVFDLMGADPQVNDGRWLLDWIARTNRAQFSRRDAHVAAPRGRFPKATDLEPALRLLEEHGYLRRVDPEPSRDPRGRGRPASPRFLVNPLPRATETTQTTKTPTGAVSVDSVVSVARGRSPQ